MNEILSRIVSDQASLWGLNVIVHTTVLAAISLLLAMLFRREAAMRYWVLCFGLLLVFASPGISALIQATGRSWLTIASKPAEVVGPILTNPSNTIPLVDEAVSDRIPSSESMVNQPLVPRNDQPLYEAVIATPVTVLQEPVVTQAASPIDWQQVMLRFVVMPLIAIWGIGSAIFLLRMLISWVRMAHILRLAKPIENARLQAAFDRACVAVGCGNRRPQLVVSELVSGPLAAGVVRSRVVLPACLLNQVDPSSFSDVLVHEVAHVVRRDQIVVLLQNIVSAIFWPHPLVRKLNRELAKAREEVCDNFVLAGTEAPAYSRTLLSIAQFVQHTEAMPGSVGFFTDRWKLENRIAGLLDSHRNKTTFLTKRGWLFVGASALGLSVLMCLGTITITSAQVDEETSVEAAQDSKETMVRGVVLKPDGSPAAGAIVRSAVPVYGDMQGVLGADFDTTMHQVTADEQGRFEIAVDKEPYGKMPVIGTVWEDFWKRTVISATVPGFAGQFTTYEDIEGTKSITLQLVEDAPIIGRVIDMEGRPVSGVTIEVKDILAPSDENLDAWLEEVKKGEPAWVAVKKIDRQCEVRMLGVSPKVTSGDYGEFVIRGLGKERCIRLHAYGNGVALEDFQVVTRSIEPITWNVVGRRDPSLVFGNKFTVTGRPSRTVRGTVTDAETGVPLVGVSVTIERLLGQNISGHRLPPAKTDLQGRFEIAELPKGEGNLLMFSPTDEQPNFMREIVVPDPNGIQPVTMDVKLHRGIWIEGKVVDHQSREPVAGVRVHYIPLLNNKYAAELSEFNGGDAHGRQDRYQTNSEGRYRIVGLPGPAIIGFVSVHREDYRSGFGYEKLAAAKDERGRVQTYFSPVSPGPDWPNSMIEIAPDAETKVLQVDGELFPQQSDPSGVSKGTETKALQKAEAAITSNVDRTSIAGNSSDDEKGKRMQFVGRVVDRAGKPIGGAQLRFVSLEVGMPASRSDVISTTNDDGAFSFGWSMPTVEQVELRNSLKYARLICSKPGYGNSVTYCGRCEVTGALASLLTDEEKSYMARSARDDKSTVITMPPDKHRVRGRVLNTDGLPVVGARVAAINVYEGKSGSLDQWRAETARPGANYYSARDALDTVTTGNFTVGGPQPTSVPVVLTDATGHFELEGLGDDRIAELLVSHDSIETSLIFVRSEIGETIELSEDSNGRLSAMQKYYPNRFTFVAGTTRPVVGRLLDYETGEPVAGVTVEGYRTRTHRSGGSMPPKAIRDISAADGSFRLVGFPIGENELHISPPSKSSYMLGGAAVTTRLQSDDKVIEIKMRKGLMQRGSIVESGTDRGVRGYFEYFAMENNPAIAETPMLKRGDQTLRYMVDPNGNFEIPILPGRGILAFHADDDQRFQRGAGAESIPRELQERAFDSVLYLTYPHRLMPQNCHYLTAIDLSSGETPKPMEIQLVAGVSVPIRVLTQDGKTVSDVYLFGQRPFAGWGEPLDDGLFVHGYQPTGGRNVMAYHPATESVASASLMGPAPKSLELQLVPSGRVTGRFVDETGEPIRDAVIHNGKKNFQARDLVGSDLATFPDHIGSMPLLTDNDGRFSIGGLMPGKKYSASAAQRSSPLNRALGDLFVDVIVKSGETKDLGDVRTVRPEMQPPKNPMKLASPKQDEPLNEFIQSMRPSVSLHGEIVDEQGKPVTGVTVIGLGPSSASMTREPLETNKFEVTGLLPETKRPLLFLHPDRSIGAVVDVQGDQKGLVRVVLTPTGTISGTLVDVEGDPITNGYTSATPERFGLQSDLWDMKLDGKGRFTIKNLVADQAYSLRVRTLGFEAAAFVRGDVRAKPGEQVELGVFRQKNKNQFEAVKMEAAK